MNTQIEPDSKPRRWLPQAIAGLVAVAAVGIGIAVLVPTLTAPPSASEPDVILEEGDTGDDEDISEDPLATVAVPTTAPLTSDEQVEIERVNVAVDLIVAATDEIAQRGDGSAVGIESVATGWVLGELQSKAREQYDLGYQQTGEAVVTSITTTAVDLAADPATMTLKVCIDVSDIDVTDAAGNSLKAALYNPGHPVAHVYGAIFEDDTWKISTHEIPDVQDCPAA
ncbi:hypothetical protein [Microbacterium sp. A93]|uniref:hypothetical protein n=1 Tax=Microbacterium sp. A93 TaxID=3450716 RepID=UPI003F434366